MGGALSEPTKLKCDALPIPDITPVGLTTYDAKDPATSFPPIEQHRPPEGAPNVLIVLIDDVGFVPLRPACQPGPGSATNTGALTTES